MTTNRVPGMTKVYTNLVASAATTHGATKSKLVKSSYANSDAGAVVLTVWKKSLLFNCNGFTVFDSKGNLVYRVDNYMAASGIKGEIVLMDAAGKPLHTIRHKRLSLGDNWLVYEGESEVNPRCSARKHANILNTKCLTAHVNPGNNNAKKAFYEVEGSYGQRCCSVYDETKRKVAEIKQKEAVGGVAFGCDVFQLVVWPEIGSSLAMAIVILLDQMFGSSIKERFSR